MNTTRFGTLETQIEALVREHIRELQRRAAEAVVRACGGATARNASGGHRGKATTAKATTAKATTGRRTPEVVSALSERLYAAICAQPGAGMGELAAQVGATSQELSLPAAQLRRTGRVRTAGQKYALAGPGVRHRAQPGSSQARERSAARGYRSGAIAAAGCAWSHALGMRAAMSSRSTPRASVGTMSLR